MSITHADHVAFSDAIEAGNKHDVQSLIDRHPMLVNHPDWTPPPIHCAVLWNQPAITEILLDFGADIETLDSDRGTTPLRYAIMHGRTAVIPVLLARGAVTGPIEKGGQSALQLAKHAATGAYENYDDLPSRDVYPDVVRLLESAGLAG